MPQLKKQVYADLQEIICMLNRIWLVIYLYFFFALYSLKWFLIVQLRVFFCTDRVEFKCNIFALEFVNLQEIFQII